MKRCEDKGLNPNRMSDTFGRRLPALKPTPITHPEYAARRTAEIIAEVEAEYQPRWDALMSRFDGARMWADNGEL